MMVNFELAIEWENGYLWISDPSGSGCKYACNSPAEIGELVTQYVEDIAIVAEWERNEGNKEY
jgi:hypothetical protein